MADRNDPIREVRRWRRGNTLTAKHLNEPVDAINRISGGVRPPRQVSAGGRPVPNGSTTKIQQFKVVSLSSDVIVCKPYNSLTSTSGALVLVAKPYLLRQTPFDGLTRDGVTYTYTNSE
jgi:hypothetical protein